MKFWRRKSDGFDWHQYVRTTIQLRREQRRARLDQIGRVAAAQAKAAGDVAVHGAALAAGASWRTTVAAWHGTIARPAVALPVTLVGGMALISGLYRWSTVGLDSNAELPLAVGGLLLGLVGPLVVVHLFKSSWRMPALNWLSTAPGALPAAMTVFIVLALGWFALGTKLPVSETTSKDASGVQSIDGRAVVLSGEMISLDGHLLHLSGIEAPDRQQTCSRADKRVWHCGEAALSALERLARTTTFHCIARSGPDATGRSEATCTADGHDVAGELVKNGHVFSVATYFGGYAALETEARRSGSGLWSGEAERPADYHDKLWAAAEASAPDHCPIKGRIDSGHKIYLMPWSTSYATANVRAARGDRWFCNEADAKAAGFSPTDSRTRKTR